MLPGGGPGPDVDLHSGCFVWVLGSLQEEPVASATSQPPDVYTLGRVITLGGGGGADPSEAGPPAGLARADCSSDSDAVVLMCASTGWGGLG
jgi:hypothetical protein